MRFLERHGFVAIAVAGLVAASCATIVGLQDHEAKPAPGIDAAIDALAPAADGATDASDGSETGPCASCAPGYACVDGACGNAVTEVAASETHACAVLHGGELWCWGKSQLGALGVDATATPERCGVYACRHAPARVPLSFAVQHVALAGDLTCVLDRKNAVRCWGRNARGEAGHDPAGDPQCPRQADAPDGAPIGTDACFSKPSAVSIGGGLAIAQLVAGSDAACARTSTGNVYCWGDDYLGESGVYPIPPGGLVPTPTLIAGIDGNASMIALSAAYGHGCAVGFFDSILCWGSNVEGELGHAKGDADAGDRGCIFTAPCDPVASAAHAASGTSVAAGQTVSCSRHGDGTVTCWGANESAELANGSSVDSDTHPSPATIAGLANVVVVEDRFLTGFAIDGAGKVRAWGLANDGALGTPAQGIACGNGTCVPSPVLVPALEGATQIASGRAGGVARKSDGSVWTWGLNDLGQLGHAPGDGDEVCQDGPCSTTPSRLVGLP